MAQAVTVCIALQDVSGGHVEYDELGQPVNLTFYSPCGSPDNAQKADAAAANATDTASHPVHDRGLWQSSGSSSPDGAGVCLAWPAIC
jgi:hypothetical protein